MFNVAHSLEPGDDRRLWPRTFPGSQSPAYRRRSRRGNSSVWEKKIFEDGVPDANVAACAACHGPDASGSGQIPRLAGQLYPYVIKELVNWGKERGQNPAKPDTSAIMSPVAHSLTRAQIEAVAAFVSYLK